MITREPTRLVREPRRFRDGVVPAQALEECKRKKSGMKECNARQNNLLLELSSWCLQDLGTKVNRKKIETLVTIHVHQKDVSDSASVSEVF